MLKKIEKIILHNFQSHEHSEIPFADFTAIVGPTDKGKSAIIRGIKWCLYNTPSGTDFIRHGQTTCYVELYFNDGTSIKRYRSNKDNYYDLINSDGTVIHLEAFGVGPVQEVLDFHQMKEVDFFGEKQSLNLCTQMSQPFFLAESSQTKAVIIGKLANTDIVDLAIKNTSLEIRENKAIAKTIKAELSDTKQQLKELRNLGKMEKDINSIQKNLDKMTELQSKLRKIDSAKTKILTLIKQKSLLESIISKETEINELVTVVELISVLQSKLNTINRLNKQLSDEITKKNSIEDLIKTVKIEDLDKVASEVDEMLQLVSKTSKVSATNKKLIAEKVKANNLQKYMIDTKEIEEVIENLFYCQKTLIDIETIKQIKKKYDEQNNRKANGDKIIKDLDNQYNNKLNEYKQALLDNQKCPVCMSEMTEEKLRNIKDIL
ncbi:MAG: AAA family ATPase [Clostridia bacterium]|nr:AAA family ATPase [Clostridia bacterium]